MEPLQKMEEGAYRLRKKEEAAFLQSPPHASSLIHLRQQDWTDGLCITGNRGKRLNCNDGGEILEYSDKKLVIGWDYWGKETFLRREDGNYWFSSYSFMAPDSSIADEYVIALCGAPGKTVAAFNGASRRSYPLFFLEPGRPFGQHETGYP